MCAHALGVQWMGGGGVVCLLIIIGIYTRHDHDDGGQHIDDDRPA